MSSVRCRKILILGQQLRLLVTKLFYEKPTRVDGGDNVSTQTLTGKNLMQIQGVVWRIVWDHCTKIPNSLFLGIHDGIPWAREPQELFHAR